MFNKKKFIIIIIIRNNIFTVAVFIQLTLKKAHNNYFMKYKFN
jgi:hypothetical protein